MLCYKRVVQHRRIGGAYWMEKIKYVVRELNKPSSIALSNLSQVVYNMMTAQDTYSATDTNTDAKSAGTITKLNSAGEMEKTA